MRLAGLFVYPVKSLLGDAPALVALELRGLAGDRRWMLVDPAGRFVTRRELSAMAPLRASPTSAGLRIDHPAHGTCAVARPGEDAPVVAATVWRDTVRLRVADDRANDFLSHALGRPLRLVFQPDDEGLRTIAGSEAPVSLADGFPLLVTTTASLAVLNAQLGAPVEMARFRPNLVIDGATAWAEDRWRRIRVGDVVLRIDSASSRCIVVTQHPDTGERHDGNEPLDTLRRIGRRSRRGVMFGQNAIPERLGTIRVGDPVEVLEEGASNVIPA